MKLLLCFLALTQISFSSEYFRIDTIDVQFVDRDNTPISNLTIHRSVVEQSLERSTVFGSLRIPGIGSKKNVSRAHEFKFYTSNENGNISLNAISIPKRNKDIDQKLRVTLFVGEKNLCDEKESLELEFGEYAYNKGFSCRKLLSFGLDKYWEINAGVNYFKSTPKLLCKSQLSVEEINQKIKSALKEIKNYKRRDGRVGCLTTEQKHKLESME